MFLLRQTLLLALTDGYAKELETLAGIDVLWYSWRAGPRNWWGQ